MHAVRDSRFKGSDASNLYDEEIGEEEQEWSDDEAEAEAKKRRKNKRGGSRMSSAPVSNRGTPRLGGSASLPQRPHFDYQPPETPYASSETGDMYGSEGGDVQIASDAGSFASGRERPMPAPYELDESSTPRPASTVAPSSATRENGKRGRGDRGRGDRGRGSQGGRDGGARSRGSAARPAQDSRRPGIRRASFQTRASTMTLPRRPSIGSFPAPPPHPQSRPPTSLPSHTQPFPQPPRADLHPFMPMLPYAQNSTFQSPITYPQEAQRAPPMLQGATRHSSMSPFHPVYPNHGQAQQPRSFDDQYHPNQPFTGMANMSTHSSPSSSFLPPPPNGLGHGPFVHQHMNYPPSPGPIPFTSQQPYLPPSPSWSAQDQSLNAPAINPRFAAQYQQRLNMGDLQTWQGRGG